MSLVSYERADERGWRWSPGWRTKKLDSGVWEVQRYGGNAVGWVHVDFVESYARARELPFELAERR